MDRRKYELENISYDDRINRSKIDVFIRGYEKKNIKEQQVDKWLPVQNRVKTCTGFSLKKKK